MQKPARWLFQSQQPRERRRSMIMAITSILCLILIIQCFCTSLPQNVYGDNGWTHTNYNSSLYAPLSFKADGTFQISIFEDLHFGENAWDSWGPQQDINTVKVMNEILDNESPQLIVLNGDLITGENTYFENSTDYIDQIVGPMVQRGLPWASTYGNHDSQYNLSRAAILQRERQWPNSRTTQMVFEKDAGISNYFLPVFANNCTTRYCTPELILWFFDSRGGYYFQQKSASGDLIPQPNWVDISVVDWFVETSHQICRRYNKTIPSLAFVHIPTNASQALQTEAEVDPNTEPGINDDYVLGQQAQGWCSDGTNNNSCDYGGQDIPFMEALVSTPGLMAVFSGHDHGNTWCYKWNQFLLGMTVQGNGINLCFGQHSGYGGYGNWIRGARQVLITQKQVFIETWIRLENQAIVGRVTLNDTYGLDKYPETPNNHTDCPTCDFTMITAMPGARLMKHGQRTEK